MRKFFFLCAILFATLSHVCSALAHEPLFMMSPEAPGKGASDWHFALHRERQRRVEVFTPAWAATLPIFNLLPAICTSKRLILRPEPK